MAESLKPQLGNLGEEKMDSATDDSGARLSGIIAQATLKYSVKDYDNAAELYSQATELQAKLNGEMSSRNADLLYAYGRCLYHVAVRNSDVLGSKVAGGKHEERTVKSVSKKPKTQEVDGAIDLRRRVDEEAITEVGEKETATDGAEEMKKGQESKPYFQFTGDENFDLSDEEDNDVEGDEEDGPVDEEDDFVNAYEVLDLARVLLLKKLGEVSVEKGTCKGTGEAQPTKQLKERLADTYDLQAEISLEGEGFPNAVVDLKAALTLKQELFPQESSLIAEAHYKLSLALEFSSVTQQKDENSRTGADGEALVDEAMREEAAKEMEAAIASCKLRIQLEEARLGTDDFQSGDMEKQKVAKENIREVKDMVKDMEQRVSLILEPLVWSTVTDLGTAY